jgi:DsbC/DsbD-like thiol-disulfide interchange protein
MARDRVLGYCSGMNRRSVFLAGMALPFAARAESQPWQTSLLRGAFDGSVWRAGLRVIMLPGWKTYWRVPGSGGVAPDIAGQGVNLKSLRVLYPMPMRLKAGDDDVIGYKDEVVFPLFLEPSDAMKPVTLKLNAFLGVCDQVCIPVRYEAETLLMPGAEKLNDDALLLQWLDRVPKPVSGVVTSATAAMGDDGKVMLKLSLAAAVSDVFVEGSSLHYFHAPTFTAAEALLNVSGAKSPDQLRGTVLRVTMATAQGGVEEMVTVV